MSEEQQQADNRKRPTTDEFRAFVAEDWAPRSQERPPLTEAAERAGIAGPGYLPAVATFATGTPVAKALADALLFSERVGHGLSVRRRGHDRRTEAAQRRAPQLLILDPGREGNMRLAGQPATRP